MVVRSSTIGQTHGLQKRIFICTILELVSFFCYFGVGCYVVRLSSFIDKCRC
jgi:hypothetical protein